MRYSWLALTSTLFASSLLSAQQPAQAPAGPSQPPAVSTLDPARNRLDALLLQWEAKMKDVKTLQAQISRYKEDRTLKLPANAALEVFDGTAKYMKPNLAILDLHKRGRPDKIEKFVCTGTHLFHFYEPAKEIRYYDLPPSKSGQVGDDNVLSFLFDIKAEDAKRRYDLKLLDQKDNWIYIEILPRSPEDKADFQSATLILHPTTLLPRRLSFVEAATGNPITWDITKLETGVPLKREEFNYPPLPSKEWQYKRMQRVNNPSTPRTNDLSPRIARPQK
jgi:TIGR03009 family protein